MLCNNRSNDNVNIKVIDGQNITEVLKYRQLNNTNNWNPCLPMQFKMSDDGSVDIEFLSKHDSIWRYWYPLNTCDYQNNSVNYNNEYLFDGDDISITNLRISDYMINDQRNYPIARGTNFFDIYHASLINISSSIFSALFYAGAGDFKYCYMSNISAKMIIYKVRKNTFR